jgi:hypothetical protein
MSNLDRKSAAGFVQGDYGNNLQIILFNRTFELIWATKEDLKNGVKKKGSFVLSRNYLI